MRQVARLLGFLALASCSDLRATGPKTSYDYCVDDCDSAQTVCGNPMYPASCSIEYDACIQSCVAKESKSTH